MSQGKLSTQQKSYIINRYYDLVHKNPFQFPSELES